MSTARPDLFDGFVAETLPLRQDRDGPVVATLVSRRIPGADRAVLYVHGYNDYFFQVEMADRWNAAGLDFYAIDLRRHGRSLRPGQVLAFTRHLPDYFEELDAAVERIRERDGHRRLILSGHSTGGLTCSLYAHHRRERGTLDGLLLNTPFLSFHGTPVQRAALRRVFPRIARLDPRWVVQKDGGPLYIWSLHKGFGKGGEWEFDLTWKTAGGLPLLAGFIGAAHRGHEEVRRGLDVRCPVLVVSSLRSGGGQEWNPTYMNSDVVLDVEDTRACAWRVGRDVTQRVVADALHDVTLSRPDVRDRAWRWILEWADGLSRRWQGG